jgi:hypothetical protein
MVRRVEPKSRRLGPLYWLLVLCVIFVWVWAFKRYFDWYDFQHPEITWARPGIHSDLVNIDGVLLWKETPLAAPADGEVFYPQGTAPVRVAKGSVVAKVRSAGKVYEIKAPRQGYFVAGTDGYEKSWRYTDLWQGGENFPEEKPFTYLKDGQSVGKWHTIGKLAEQPQQLRFIGCSAIIGNMESQMKGKSFKVKMDGDDTVSAADIRVYDAVGGGRFKFYLTLPWFPPGLMVKRHYRLTIGAGSTEGAIVPAAALVKKGTKTGVYLVRASRVIFAEVKGRVISGDRFLATEGISVGDAVVEDSSTAREGRIQLW